MLELPAGVPVKFRVTSDDVLHGFAIPQLGVAMDANPGKWIYTPVVTPTRLGSYYAHCIELCGLYHTYMWSTRLHRLEVRNSQAGSPQTVAMNTEDQRAHERHYRHPSDR